MLHIEAVTVCVNYSDFLAVTIPYNLALFDRWIIGTEPEDTNTRDLCRRYGLECLQSRDHRNGEFAKGALCERLLQHCSGEGWRMHIDADIALPLHTRHVLEAAELQEDTIYGADRIMCRNPADFQRLLKTGWLQGGQHGWSCTTNFPPGFELGSRWVSPLTGYVPIGFMQLFHSSQDEWNGVRVKHYPQKHNSACRTDVQFGLKWDRPKRALIPELVVAHLESELVQKGANWNGRKTKQFEFPGAATPAPKGPAGS